MIVADTGAILALIDSDDRHHQVLRNLYMAAPESWTLPWAILPEVDYLLASRVGPRAEELFVEDLAAGAWIVEWGIPQDLSAARTILRKFASLRFGLVDAIVMAVAQRLRADAIATVDLRDFSAVSLEGNPRIIPRDL